MSLELRNVTKTFGAVKANDGVSLHVREGSIHAIVGENGAGKSTAMRIAYGMYTPDSGEVVVDRKPRHLRSPEDAIALGIGMVHQHFTLVDTLTVAENVVLGSEPGSLFRIDHRRATASVAELSTRLGITMNPDALVGDLSVGQQQRVELLKALYRDARILILDEPTAVLAPQEVDELFGALRAMRSDGRTIVIITHKLAEVLAISDDVTVMRDGRVVGATPTSQTTAADLARMMVGRDVLLRVEKSTASPGAVVLSVRNLNVRDTSGSIRLHDVSLDVRSGEIVGVAAIEGNGQTELIEALAGLVTPDRVTGTITVSHLPLRSGNVAERRLRGVAHVPEDRHRRGLLLDFTLAENAILGFQDQKPIAGRFFIDRDAVEERTRTLLQEHDVRPADPAALAASLSGGNQQKLIIGREIQIAPRVLLIAQPTRGVDIGAIEAIHRKIIALRDSGCAVLLVSAELEELLSLSDRLVVLHDGGVAGEVDAATASREHIGLLMTGGRT